MRAYSTGTRISQAGTRISQAGTRISGAGPTKCVSRKPKERVHEAFSMRPNAASV
jgi:homoserine kinase